MRISIEPTDAGYAAWLHSQADGRKVKVTLDGIEQRDCVTADDVEGFVRRAVRTEAGNIVIDQAAGEIVHETVRGRVEIEVA